MLLTLEQTKKLVHDAVECHPKRKNPSVHGTCFYTSKSGKTHCIVGQVLKDAGLPVPPFGFYGNVHDLVDLWERGEEVHQAFTKDAWGYLREAQVFFDHGGTWKKSFQTLEEYLCK